MKVIKRILICLLILLAYYLFFGSGKTYAYYVGQTGLNIIFDNLIEYDPSQPYNCTQQGEKPLCGSASGGSHYYQVISRTWLYEISRTGSGASISSNTGKVSWKKYNDSTYQIGAYKVNYTGSVTKVVISTDKGTVTLRNNSTSSNGNYSVSNIVSGQNFYIYVKKSTGVKEIKSVTVYVSGTLYVESQYRYELHCYATGGSHGRYGCWDPSQCQILECWGSETDSDTEEDHVKLPGALGIIELNIYKRDKYLPDVGVPGAKYELWSDGKKQYSGTTDSSGHLLLDEVLIGDYIIKEVYVPYGFEIEGYATMNGKKFTDLTNMKVNLDDDSAMYVYNESYIDIGGIVFLDAKTGKANGPPNGYYDSGDKVVEGIEVKLYRADNNQELETRYTDSNGKYEFKHRTKAYNYYIRFKYNGQIYEATTYNETSAAAKFRSYATEGLNERRTFNNKFTPVNANHTVPKWTDTSNSAFNIYAYTGADGPNNKKTYGKNNTTDELKNINLGIKERDIFDLNLRKDLVNVDVSIKW